jgi:hypothetical protein
LAVAVPQQKPSKPSSPDVRKRGVERSVRAARASVLR